MAELERCFYETKSTRLVTQIEWPRDCDFVTIRSPNAIITRKEIEDELEG